MAFCLYRPPPGRTRNCRCNCFVRHTFSRQGPHRAPDAWCRYWVGRGDTADGSLMLRWQPDKLFTSIARSAMDITENSTPFESGVGAALSALVSIPVLPRIAKNLRLSSLAPLWVSAPWQLPASSTRSSTISPNQSTNQSTASLTRRPNTPNSTSCCCAFRPGCNPFTR